MASLLHVAETCRAVAAALPDAASGDPSQINRAPMRVSRALVPPDCTAGGRFQPDPALPLPPWPVLELLRALVAACLGTDEAQALAVVATRARNRLRDAATALGTRE